MLNTPRISFSKALSILVVILLTTLPIFQVPVFSADSCDDLDSLQSKIASAMYQKASNLVINYKGNTDSLRGDIEKIINNIYDADDYLHYSSKSYSFSASGFKNDINLTLSFVYLESDQELKLVEESTDKILQEIITPNMNSFQKEKAIHDWIITHVSYDESLVNHSAYAALVKPYSTVCQGYSLLGYKMFKKAGIPVRILEGTADSVPHNWLLLELEGNWYHLDLTWNDPVPDVKGKISYEYYNLTDEEMKASKHIWNKSYPPASTSFNNTLASKIPQDPSGFFTDLRKTLDYDVLLPENTFYSLNDLGKSIHSAISKGSDTLRFRYMKGSSLSTDLGTILSETSTIDSYAYSMKDYTKSSESSDVLVSLNFTFIQTPLNQAPAIVSTTSSLATSDTTTRISNPPTPKTKALNSKVKSPAKTSPILIKSAYKMKRDGSPIPLIRTSPKFKNITFEKWDSGNQKIATVSSNGYLIPVQAGTATVTGISSDGKYEAQIKIIIK